ncbi:thiolase family protein [Cypionkella sp.]|uniref:thiolase family protein n=1 Tax=Cypionkella sp. TaxID=2811411 RepID=UPI002ABA138F|nr:thiolase family protein [Cypionkella sp.]MDZ4276789.1 thiolase family protein [Erythrobacter sp.]MDZ4394747.1 thiolase family protein [Cypionkella sp.]
MSVILAARRTAVVPWGGAFSRLEIEDLAAPVVQALLTEAGISGGQVDELICANALGAGGNPARRVALAAGLPERVAGLSVDRQCAGGLDAILLARALVESGAAEVVVAGGVESYSRRPLRLRTDPEGGPAVAYEQARFTPWADRDPGMAEAAEALALRLGISRAAQDLWAVQSHAKARVCAGEIVALAGQQRDVFARGLSLAVAARAKVVCGSITAANAAVAADAAAFVLVVSDRIAAGRGLRILGGATLGGDPVEPGLAPVAAIRAVLERAGVSAQRVAVAEIMEAYAVQAMACVAGAGLDGARVNPGGGALARGHPIGASGAVLAVRLFYELQAGIGLAAIAAAGGIGTALLVER